MKTGYSIFVVLIAVLFCGFQECTAKGIDSNDLVVADSTFEQFVEMKDGSIYIGRISEVSSDSITFRTKEVEFTIAIEDIKEIKKVYIGEKGYRYPDKNHDKLFFSPTGTTLQQGEGYFIDYYLFFPGLSYGLTDNITIGGGMSFFPGLNMDDQLLYFTPKLGIVQTRSYSLALGTFIFRFPDEGKKYGMIFGMNTYEKGNIQLTAGVGYGYRDGDLSDRPAFIGGINWRISEQVAFISENWYIPDEIDPLISYGVRFIGEKICVDLGLFNIVDENFDFPVLLYGNFSFHF